jgi:uncharacterized membrane protein
LKRLLSATTSAAILLTLLSPQATAYTSNSLVVQVYSDGSAFVTQKLTVDQSATSADVSLLTTVLSNVIAVDQNGSPLSFKLSGSNLTIFTLGSTGVTLRYDTLNLTSKKGTVWTLDFSTRYNATVVLPRLSTLSYISGTPFTLQVQNGSPVVTVSPGTWELSYGVPIAAATSNSTSTSSGSVSTGPGGPGGVFGGGLGVLPWIGALSLVVVGGFLAFRWWRRRLDLGAAGAELRQDDVQVLNFIQEKGGKVLEPEVRTRFALPKTSAWRQIKRLERLGYVKVTRIGSQNQIELLKNRETGV